MNDNGQPVIAMPFSNCAQISFPAVQDAMRKLTDWGVTVLVGADVYRHTSPAPVTLRAPGPVAAGMAGAARPPVAGRAAGRTVVREELLVIEAAWPGTTIDGPSQRRC